MASILEFDHVSRTYREGASEIHALRDVSLQFVPGELVAVVGPSGSGKSTLLHLAGALDIPSTGAVRIAGDRTDGMGEDARAKLRLRTIGFVFQFFNLIPTLSALENVAVPALITGERASVAYKKAGDLLDRVGLSARAAHFPEQLSGGEQQRVALARALILEAPLLLADEPTGNLDSATGHAILRLVGEFRAGRSIVVVTHDAKAEAVADRVIRIRDGRVE
ncbi:MAG: ABC transporter ATP-binding protein [Fimbriimonas sp.]